MKSTLDLDQSIKVSTLLDPSTLIVTDQGYLPIKELIGTNIRVWNGQKFVQSDYQLVARQYPVFRINLGKRFIRLNALSAVVLRNDRVCDVLKLRAGDYLKDHFRGYHQNPSTMVGAVYADGTCDEVVGIGSYNNDFIALECGVLLPTSL